MNYNKYKKYPKMRLDDRNWPSNTIDKAPVWCSVDLRDGNQALPVPMSVEKKLKYYELLKQIGFKDIEVSFPSASDTDFNLVRTLIEKNMVDDDMAIQVLTQAREHLIKRTYESLEGANRAILHLYNSTSVQQRRVVFKMSKQEIIDIAVKGANLVRELGEKSGIPNLTYEYSPESFTGTEMEYALEICEAVLNVWEPTPDNKMIINLPATVEMSTPNVFADQVEWFGRNISKRDSVIISIHAHNDRGTAVAASELAMLAGADRVEGTLFGNGERTGNADILNLAMNLYSQGINPGINIENVNDIIGVYEECTGLKVHERHPYAGELVYTAFSGSHQDAIRKGLKVYDEEKPEFWEVPYLPIDPSDIGREYEAIIRINSQSGKGGVAFILEQEYGFHLPKAMHPEFGKVIKQVSDKKGSELTPKEIYGLFKETYLECPEYFKLKDYTVQQNTSGEVEVKTHFAMGDKTLEMTGKGNGPISAFFDALMHAGIKQYKFITYEEHALSRGEDAEAVAYVAIKNGGDVIFGVGIDANTTTASFKAIISALNRAYINK